MASADLREELTCSICLDLYEEPVSLKCGHNFCRDCITTAMATQKSEKYFCPECREQYTEQPQLEKNRKLWNIVENFRATYQKEAEVFCTYCDGPVPAIKTCLHCEASFCSKHLNNHSKSADHILTDPTTSCEQRKCSTHKEFLKYYCPEDGSCICMSCWVAGDHKAHQVELLYDASEKTKDKLKEITNTLNCERQKMEQRIQNLVIYRTEEKEKTVDATGRVTGLFRDIREKLDNLENNVLTEICRQEEEMAKSVSDLICQLEEQKDEMSRKIIQMNELFNSQDPITVLKNAPNADDFHPQQDDSNDDVRCLDEGIISEMLHRGLLHFTDSLIDLKIKKQFSVMEKSDILLDINTAHNNIFISKDLRSASHSDTSLQRPEGPERFKSKQVLSITSFTSGKHYWEVDVSGAEKWLIGVVAESIERKINGNESFIGYNDKSWGLEVIQNFGAQHNKIFQMINSDSPVKSVGIYLDYEGGRLSFYQLCDPVRHLHTFTTTFTEPLRAAFYVFPKSSVRII